MKEGKYATMILNGLQMFFNIMVELQKKELRSTT